MTTIDLCSDDETPSNRGESQISSSTSGVWSLDSVGSQTKASCSSSGVYSAYNADYIFEQRSNESDSSDVTPLKAVKKKGVKKTNNVAKKKASKALALKEKAHKLATKANSKVLKPGECLKFIVVNMDFNILNKSYATKVIETLTNSNIKYVNVPPEYSDCNSIAWVRNHPQYNVDDNGELKTSNRKVQENFKLIVYEMTDMAELLIKKSLNEKMSQYKTLSKCQITILLYGSRIYFNTNKKSKSKKIVNENDLDYYLTKLLFEESVSCLKAETPEEFAKTILQFTKSISEIPFKKEKYAVDLKAAFYMRGDNKSCIQVNKNGVGLIQLWSRSLTKFPFATHEKAQAICDKFPSPFTLMKFIEENNESNAIKEIADIPIRRSADPCAATRRLGKQLAQKIYAYFTSTDGKQVL